MKRLVVLALVLLFVVSLSTAAFADPVQVGYGILEEAMSGDVVRVTVDLADNWSVGFYPMAFYLHDQPVQSNDADYVAYGTLLSAESYESILEVHADDERTDKDGVLVFTATDGEISFVAPIDENLYLLLLVDPAVDADAVWTRISWEKEDYSFADPAQFASGVLADSMDDSVLVRVKLDLSYSWSAKFYPMAFYLCSADCENEDEFDAYGTLLNAQSYASLIESHSDDESLTEREDGTIVYKTEEYTGFVAPVDENEYITLLVYPPFDADAMWERLSFEVF